MNNMERIIIHSDPCVLWSNRKNISESSAWLIFFFVWSGSTNNSSLNISSVCGHRPCSSQAVLFQMLESCSRSTGDSHNLDLSTNNSRHSSIDCRSSSVLVLFCFNNVITALYLLISPGVWDFFC